MVVPAVCGEYLSRRARTTAKIYPGNQKDEAGLKETVPANSLSRRHSQHASPECPGSINEGGETG